MNIGNNLKLLRTQKQISQKELAKTLGITHNYLSMVENNAKKPSLSLLEKISEVLGVPLYSLFQEKKLQIY